MLTTNDWLPIGSVVHLAGSEVEELVTIFGYLQQDAGTGLLWDYVGLLHPMGFLQPGNEILFDRDSIDGVLYVGYQDFDWERMKDALENAEGDYQAKKDAAEKAAKAAGVVPAAGGE